MMLYEYQKKTNIGVGIGTLIQIVGFAATFTENTGIALLGLVPILLSLPIFIWGCTNYAEGRGHSKWVGLVGLAGLIGLVVLVLLPDESEGPSKAKPVEKVFGLISIVLGICLLGTWRWIYDLTHTSAALERKLMPYSKNFQLSGHRSRRTLQHSLDARDWQLIEDTPLKRSSINHLGKIRSAAFGAMRTRKNFCHHLA